MSDPVYFTAEALNQNTNRRFAMRTEDVKCNELRDIMEDFPPSTDKTDKKTNKDKQDIVIKVRGIEGEEFHKASNYYNEEYKAVLEGFQEGLLRHDKKMISEATAAALGLGGDKSLPANFLQKKMIIGMGCIKPTFTESQINNMAKFCVVVFERLSSKIFELTGMGPIVKKKP
jgi:hypothetical protein